jgi:4-hydroxy-2-oxoheptanedioate aldolase
MRKNKLKEKLLKGESVVNGWLQIPSSFSAEVMAKQGWDSITMDLQHGVIDYPNALQMLQAISTTETVPMARVNWNEPGQIMKILDAGCYGVICPMVSNRQQAENFVGACLYPPKGYRSFGPIRGLLYGGADYGKYANDEILKFAMIETKEALDKLDEIMSTPGLDGIYIGPADLSLAIGAEPSFDKPEGDKVYDTIMKILEHAKKNKVIPGIHNGTAAYAKKMINKGFQLVTVGSDQRLMTSAAQSELSIIKDLKKTTSKTY